MSFIDKINSNRWHVLKSLVTLQNRHCPYCFSKRTEYIGRNAPLSHVRRCHDCALMFRWPKQNAAFNSSFYQSRYSQKHRGRATNLPSLPDVEAMKTTNFFTTPLDSRHYVELATYLGCKRVLDYGCAWGYATFQYLQAGFEAEGLEVSWPRAEFGRRHLGVHIFNGPNDVVNLHRKYDLIFTSHVLEHLPSPTIALTFFEKIVAPSGWLLCAVPNCGGRDARKLGLKWGPFSSSIHPLSYREEFFVKNLHKHGFDFICSFSKPFHPAEIMPTARPDGARNNAEGYDLIVLAKNTRQ
jgi:2-polyprenyl-3-methyl-5-hydroxy-6-metoxy-1,4-benzoquinol methylase